MPRYGVLLHGTCEMVCYVEADSPAQARRMARNGEHDDTGEYEPLGDWKVAKEPVWIVVEDEDA